MSLAELRDLFIVIFAVLGIGATIFLSLIAFLIYRRIGAVLDSTRDIRSITSAVSEDLIKPLASIAGIVQGIAKPLEFISSRRKGGEKGGRRE